ncbi:helix-turn-helix domain-containing protein [Schaedlerella arabinosiphila]|uniref:helix-turn-helix domain-containing protein n=1 Tax=Schaedlerella arabinosiphila TaxID=2044587 RepID=UPI0025580734|nr:helix-turn-helix domain-containing protein [Schaedlerella arabinosiphila]
MSAPLLAAKLAELRQSRGISQKELADYLGITREAYSHYERSTREPNLEVIMKLVNFYGIQVSDLINETTIPILHSSEGTRNDSVKAYSMSNTDTSLAVSANFISSNIMHFLKLFTGKNSTIDLTDITKEDINVLAQYKKLNEQCQKEVRQFIKFKYSFSKDIE